LSYGDAVTVAFESGDSGRPYITSFRPHLGRLPNYVKRSLAPAAGMVSEGVTLQPLPITVPLEAVRFGYSGYAQVHAAFLVE
jgi:hypothetical protein